MIEKENYFLSIWIYRSIRDFFSPLKKVQNSPIMMEPDKIGVWMVGHSTVLINLHGTMILTDPVLVNGLPFPRRLVRPGYAAGELPPLDYIIVSHAHLDHLNKRTLKNLAHKTHTIIVPRNCAGLVEWMGFKRVIELDWNEKFSAGDLVITAYEVEHWGKRFPWEDTDRGYNCYAVEKNGRGVFFAGDTGYGDFFERIGKSHPVNVALLPISAYKPSIFRPHHMNPEDAVRSALDLGAEHIVPIHWGNFRLSLEPITEPPELLMHHARIKNVEGRIHLLKNGEGIFFD